MTKPKTPVVESTMGFNVHSLGVRVHVTKSGKTVLDEAIMIASDFFRYTRNNEKSCDALTIRKAGKFGTNIMQVRAFLVTKEELEKEVFLQIHADGRGTNRRYYALCSSGNEIPIKKGSKLHIEIERLTDDRSWNILAPVKERAISV